MRGKVVHEMPNSHAASTIVPVRFVRRPVASMEHGHSDDEILLERDKQSLRSSVAAAQSHIHVRRTAANCSDYCDDKECILATNIPSKSRVTFSFLSQYRTPPDTPKLGRYSGIANHSFDNGIAWEFIWFSPFCWLKNKVGYKL